MTIRIVSRLQFGALCHSTFSLPDEVKTVGDLAAFTGANVYEVKSCEPWQETGEASYYLLEPQEVLDQIKKYALC